MRITPVLALGLSAGVLLLAACGGGSTSAPMSQSASLSQSLPELRSASAGARVGVNIGAMGLPRGFQPTFRPGGYVGPGWLSDDAKKPGPKVYVADNNASAIEIYKPTGGAPIGAITTGLSGPLGIWLTAAGTLYVTNINNNTVTVYPQGTIKPSMTLTGTTKPTSVTVAKSGEVYVTSFSQNAVYVFKSGATKPAKTVALTFPEGSAIDSTQNLYVAYNDSSLNGHAEKYSPGAIGGTDLGITLGTDGDIRIAKSADFIISDQTNDVINTYKPGKATPVTSISTTGHDPFKFALDSTESLVYVADPNENVLVVYTYPAGVVQKTTFSGLSSVYGVAVSPPAPY